MTTTQQITLVRQPAGLLQLDCFRLVETPVPPVHPGQVLVRLIYLAVDPYSNPKLVVNFSMSCLAFGSV